MTQIATVTWHQTENRDVNKVAVGLGLTSFLSLSRGVKEGPDAGLSGLGLSRAEAESG